MGLFKSVFKSVFKPFKSIFKETKKTIFGTPDKMKFIRPEQMIMKPSSQEEGLLRGLYPIAQDSLRQYRSIRPGRFLNQGILNYNRQLPSTMSLFNQALDSARRIAQGELPDSFRQMIASHFNQQMGGLLNTMAQRGIINSSVTQNAISGALRRTMEERAKLLPMALQLSQAPLDVGLRRFNFAVNTPMSMFNVLREAQKDYLSFPANLYSQMMSARFGVRGMPVVMRGNGGLLGSLGGGLGAAIGYGMGGPIGGAIGSWIGSKFGNSGGA